MKHYLLSFAFLLFALTATAQDVNMNNVVNTLKDRIKLSGYAQLGYTYNDTGSETNEFDIKRIIFMAEGKVTDKWSCFFMYNFANSGSTLEVYTEYKFLPQLTARIGQFKTMYSMESQISPCDTELINCYSQVVNYLAGINGSDPLYGSHGGRDMGLMIYGDLLNNLMTYNIAIMNGQGINVKDKNNNKDIVGSLVVKPLNWLSVGATFNKGKGCAVAESSINPTIKVGESYTRNRWSAGATIKTKPISLRTEYLAGKDGSIKSDGYFVTASAHLLPKFDMIASYDYINRNKAIDDKQTNYVVGVQYHFYPRCRIQAQYTHCNREIGSNNNLLQAQLQVRF